MRADGSQWKAPALSRQILDGELYGRGALDMKGLGILRAMTLLVAARERVALQRDLIFLPTADEEVDDRGSAWMIAKHPERDRRSCRIRSNATTRQLFLPARILPHLGRSRAVSEGPPDNWTRRQARSTMTRSL